MVWENINQMGKMKCWCHQIWNFITVKWKIPQKRRMGKTCFIYVAVIGGKTRSI